MRSAVGAPLDERRPLAAARPCVRCAFSAAAGRGQRLRAAVLEHAAQRVEVGAHRLRQRRAQLVEVEQVDVEVAQVAGDGLQALELVAEVLQALGIDRA